MRRFSIVIWVIIILWLGRLSSRCSYVPHTSRLPVTDVDWYGCDSVDPTAPPRASLTARPHSAAATDSPMSPSLWHRDSATATSRLLTTSPVQSPTPAVLQSRHPSARARHEQQRRHYMETGVDEPKYDNNDLLQRHQRWFSKERPFTPRTLQSAQVADH